MPKQKLTRQRLRKIIKEEKRKIDEAKGGPKMRNVAYDLDLKQRFGFKEQDGI